MMQVQKLVDYFQEWSASTKTSSHLFFGDKGASGQFGVLTLNSAFQPLLDAQNMHTIAYEALLRVTDQSGRAIAPDSVFKSQFNNSGVVGLDRLCRVIHSINFYSQITEPASLFLNVNGRHLLGIQKGHHGSAFETLLSYCGLTPSQIVLEILESKVEEIDNVQEAITTYKSKGFRIAIDDFGADHSNFDRLWKLTPDIVKIDRSLIVQADHNPRAAKMLPHLVRLIHELGVQVVCEGIETYVQHIRSLDSGADILQGYYYARPDSQLPQVDSSFIQQPLLKASGFN